MCIITPEERSRRAKRLLTEIRAESETGIDTSHGLLLRTRKRLLAQYAFLRNELSPENAKLLDVLMDIQYVEGILLRAFF